MFGFFYSVSCFSLCFSLPDLQKFKMPLLYHEFLCLHFALWDKFVFSATQKFKMLVVSWMFLQKCWMLWILEIVRYSSIPQFLYILCFCFYPSPLALVGKEVYVSHCYRKPINHLLTKGSLSGQWFCYLFQCHCFIPILTWWLRSKYY